MIFFLVTDEQTKVMHVSPPCIDSKIEATDIQLTDNANFYTLVTTYKVLIKSNPCIPSRSETRALPDNVSAAKCH